MEGQSGILELIVHYYIYLVSTVEGCSISGVPVLFSGSSPAFGCIMYENRVHYVTKKLEKNEAKGDYVR